MSDTQDRYAEFASIGAGRAATALAKIFDCTVLLEPPRCYRLEVGHLPEAMVYDEQWTTAIFADLEGSACGQAGILLSDAVVHGVVRRLVREEPGDRLSERALSALSELGNIVLSAAAGAIGDLVGGIVMPSLPRLGFEMSEALLLERLGPGAEQSPAYLAETELIERDGSLRIRFVWIPEE